ncbi:TIGR01459 family HAD-type hydrolase [Aureimonas sp. Leaf454]|uniref:TIGR01459 family HAD-type hydrolase n=1 Tax=Aureimonas sp. Leaf454 TaxID=1736381 RepID=UPI0009E861D7|nr:TIGR01459 family HAD-type hydrolase [Aureimonas sp. Leaf454]
MPSTIDPSTAAASTAPQTRARAAAEPMSVRGLSEIVGGYAAIFCDIWGVLHNGEEKSASAEAALLAARADGATVILVSNSPRTSMAVGGQLDAMHVSRDAYDAIVTSGDVTRALVAAGGRRVYHLGPTRDRDLFEGLDISCVGEDEAEIIVATGLFNDEVDVPEDYAGQLARLKERDLPMICANPDIIVHRGGRLIWCAGALARDYVALGGEVRMAGKPHAPIYAVAEERAGVSDRSRILAVGDGLNTDIRGANAAGIDALLVVGGIHGEELGGAEVQALALGEALASQSLTTRYFMPALA